MRNYRFIVLLVFAMACKATSTSTSSSSSNYYEDLSLLRPEISTVQEKESEKVYQEGIDVASIEGHIMNELDSVNRIIIADNKTKKWDGYRIQIYTGNSRQQAEQNLSSIREYYPDLDSDMTYYQPTYRVKAGYFFDRLEASKMYEEIKKMYPRAILLPEKLPLPAIDE